jgi:uncharacterized OsmC-like protein
MASDRIYEIRAETRPQGAARVFAKGSEIPFDASAGQDPILPGPTELLAAAFAACILKNVERFSEFLRFRYESASIHVTVEREPKPPRIARIRYTLVIATDEPLDRLALLEHNLRKFGTVYNTLSAACSVSGAVVRADGKPKGIRSATR